MTQQEPSSRPDLMGEVRLRVPLPFIVPLVAVVVIAAATFGFSRVLLTIPAEAATVVALATAANVLVASAFIALRPRLHRVSVLEIALIALYPVLIGVVLANTNIGEEAVPAEEAATQQEGSAPAPGDGGGLALTASGLQFDTSELSLPAGEEVTITLNNEDTAPHNLAIYRNEQDASAQANALFDGPDVAPGESADYTFKAPPKGDYPFQCDIHPAMAGTATAG
jgi:plastocyanin